MKKFFALIAIAGAVAAGWFYYTRTAGPGGEAASAGGDARDVPPAAYVRVSVARADGVARESVTQNMSIEAIDRVLMTPRVTGRLERLHVRQGERVSKGQLVATLEHDQEDAQIGASEAQVASARADAERARAELMNAKTTLDRYERLVAEGFSTQHELDAVITAHASAKAGLDAAAARLRQAEAESRRARVSRGDYIMYSPLDGTLLNDYSLTPGAMISPASPIADIADLRRMKATLRVPEAKIFSVRPGMDVLLRFEALPGEEFRGEVSRIDQYVDPATRTSAVEIELDNETSGNRLRPGMFGTASIVMRERQNALMVPDNALHHSDSGPYLFVEEDGTARRRDVELGVRASGTVEIISGLVSGDRVITFGGANLNDGDPVSAQ